MIPPTLDHFMTQIKVFIQSSSSTLLIELLNQLVMIIILVQEFPPVVAKLELLHLFQQMMVVMVVMVVKNKEVNDLKNQRSQHGNHLQDQTMQQVIDLTDQVIELHGISQMNRELK